MSVFVYNCRPVARGGAVGPEAKEVSSNKKKFVPLDGMLRSWRELGAVNECHED